MLDLTSAENSCPLRISTPSDEGELKVSRWLKHQVLLDDVEMEALLQHLAPISICAVSEPIQIDQMVIHSHEFLDKYKEYTSLIKIGKIPDPKVFRKMFSTTWTRSLDMMYAMAVSGSRYLVKAIRPVVQLQMHHFYYSSVDHKYHSMVLSPNSISWGIQFSYPQVFQDPLDHSYEKVVNSERFPNTQMFLALAKWMRAHTIPACFVYDGKRTFVPMRLGKKCMSWISNHPQLQANNISIEIDRERKNDAH